MNGLTLVVTDHGPPERYKHIPAIRTNLDREITELGAGRKSLELRAFDCLLSITGGQGGYYIVGIEQPHGWRNVLQRDFQEGMIELVAGGQRASYPLALCLPHDVVLKIVHEFIETGVIFNSACKW